MSVGPSNPARRAVARWAWRLFRREWRQQLATLTLITLAVAASVATTAIAVNAASTANSFVGDANALIRLDATDRQAADNAIAAATQRFGEVEVISHQQATVPGLDQMIDVRDQDPNGVYSHPTLALRAGRYPARSSEVAITGGVADLLGTHIGDKVDFGGVSRTVVGEVENPRDLDDEFALVATNTNDSADSLTVLVDTNNVDASPTTDGPAQAQFQLEVFGDETTAVAAFVLVAITIAMALVGLIASAGFVVVAQRRQRQLGLLAAIGATPRHLRLVMLVNGAIVGVIAAGIGAGLGVIGWIAAAPAVEISAAHRIDRLALPWGLIALCMAIAVIMATAAAWWPARTMARLPVISALSGRPTRPAAVHRSLLLASGLVVVGIAGIVTARPIGDHVRPLLLVGGVLAVVLGFVLAAPAAIRALARPAAHAPFAPRLALRELVRYQARAGVALAAITLALGIAVSVMVLAQANVEPGDQGNLSDRQLVIRVGDPFTDPDPNLTPAQLDRLDAQASQIAATLGRPDVFPLDVAVNPSTAENSNIGKAVVVVRPYDGGFRGLGQAYVASPELLAHYGIELPANDDTTELLTSLPGDVMLLDESAPPPRDAQIDPSIGVRKVPLPSYSSAPNSLVTAAALRHHGWVPARAGWLVESSTPLTPAQITAARQAAAADGLTIEVRKTQDDLARLRTIATATGALLALAIVAMTIGLIRSESTRDMRTLTATGASSRTRRAITASTAGALALLGVVLGTAGAYVALIAAFHSDLARLTPAPITDLVLLVVGLPLLAAGAGWLLAGREPRQFARQQLD